jgi:hypothetical protein
MERKIGEVYIKITPEGVSGTSLYLRVKVITPSGEVGEEVVEYHNPPHQLPYVMLMGRAAKLLSPKGMYKLSFGEKAQAELEEEISSFKASLLRQGLQVIKGPVTLRRIVGQYKSIVFLSPQEPRSALSVVQQTFAPFFSAIASNPSCFEGREGVTICDPIYDDYSFIQDIHFSPSTLPSLIREVVEAKVRELRRKIDDVATMPPEEAVRAWWIERIHVTEEGFFSECPPYCDDCLWVEVWGPAPREVKAAAPYYSVRGRYGKVFSYRRVDEKSFQLALRHPELERWRADTMEALQAELRKNEELLGLLEE